MTIRISKPTTPGRRHYQTVDYRELSKEKPLKALVVHIQKHSGRNSAGRITVRHRGGGHKQQYRMVELGQKFLNFGGIVEALEYDPGRTAFIARVLFSNGMRSYILAPEGLHAGDRIETGEKVSIKVGNRMRLKYIPVGTLIHAIELRPGAKGILARSAGSYATVMANEGAYTLLKMPSGETRKVSSEGFTSIGQVSNGEHRIAKIGKAGRMRHHGVRPTVRGSVMNPRDHPYGGGEGRTTRGTRKPKDKWGNITGGHRTRKRHNWSQKFIVSRRPPNTKKKK
ncbi:MAG: 50S ribosomal protein L2 [Parcubacteria group bacterium GW2011_GWB1_46_8]|nr:MAG: 50S ribosomal protein L2 [Parcubacteria group bacterium GW2011_GWA1_45_7]KKU10327.1 MAG: 50S ribosomal protein L2 [Parcubacteria group bacterium GW2011_GWF1_45_5]KKU44103.1 MAG: 50S ribosomal protein L2 [Parcubacteria group bacterium GW2011_GWA2_46_7]KKU46672.1 MAG: 50S ribosomal protein L2 [Parcubacteria group bacterium GW2011_GWB1_46_8]KKU47150.1 MAG: 50S ribosomal protein L2 [Parcubacteria group bacterium GW2011_GWF2_46_8]